MGVEGRELEFELLDLVVTGLARGGYIQAIRSNTNALGARQAFPRRPQLVENLLEEKDSYRQGEAHRNLSPHPNL